MSKPKLVFASNNSGKLKEIRSLLIGCNIEILPQSLCKTPAVEESGLSFIENAILKARNAAQHCRLPAFADDSGLAVDCLQGAPGIHSARYGGEQASDTDNINLLLKAMARVGDKQRQASFFCVIAFLQSAGDPDPKIFKGRWQGQISRQPAGTRGFGYDPVFYLEDGHCTVAQLSADEKNRRSHRALAMRQFVKYLHSNSSFYTS